MQLTVLQLVIIVVLLKVHLITLNQNTPINHLLLKILSLRVMECTTYTETSHEYNQSNNIESTSGGLVIPATGGIIQMQKSTTRSTADDTTSTSYAEINSDYRVAFTPVTANSYTTA